MSGLRLCMSVEKDGKAARMQEMDRLVVDDTVEIRHGTLSLAKKGERSHRRLYWLVMPLLYVCATG